MTVEELLSQDQFALDPAIQRSWLIDRLTYLTEHHAQRCEPYAAILNTLWPSWPSQGRVLSSLPFVPVSIFKRLRLASIPDRDVYTTLHSSGTTGQLPSVVVLDERTSQLQSRAFASVLRGVLGGKRLPMLVIDRRQELTGQHARSVGIRGMLPLSRRYEFALGDDLRPDLERVRRFVADCDGEPFIVFGFTFLVWQFIQQASRVDMTSAVLIHSGGWKKLAASGVTNDEFKQRCAEAMGISRVHNFYGMAEQVGSVFLEDSNGYLRAPACAEVIVRDPLTWLPVPDGQPGVLQVLSALPESYPGHSILTEDLGVIHSSGAEATMTGTRFRVLGRLPRAELRGCSDVVAREF